MDPKDASKHEIYNKYDTLDDEGPLNAAVEMDTLGAYRLLLGNLVTVIIQYILCTQLFILTNVTPLPGLMSSFNTLHLKETREKTVNATRAKADAKMYFQDGT